MSEPSGTERALDEQSRRMRADEEREPQIWRALADLQKSIDRLQDRSLSEEDAKALRELLEADRRTRWLWSSARAWAVWIAAVVAGYTVGLDALKSVLKRLVQ